MKFIKTIGLTAIAFWLAQLVLFALMLATWFSHFILQWFAAFGWALPYTSFQKFLFKLMTIITYPTRLFLRPGWFGDDSITTILLLGANSAIWGVVLGSLIYLVGRKKPDGKSARPKVTG